MESATAGLEPAHAVPPVGGDVELVAQRKPHLARIDPRGDRGLGGAPAYLGEDEIRHDRGRAGAEFIRDRAIEFTSAHSGIRFLSFAEGRCSA